jgi:hypothetical protein
MIILYVSQLRYISENLSQINDYVLKDQLLREIFLILSETSVHKDKFYPPFGYNKELKDGIAIQD